jgi:integrase
VDEITRDDVLDLLAPIARKHPAMSNRVFSTIRCFFSWLMAQARSPLRAHPVAGLERPASERPRDHVLSDEEIQTVWDASAELAPTSRSLIRVALLSACRRSEIMSATWRDLDFKNDTWTLPKTKNGRAHVVPLSPMLKSIFESIGAERPDRTPDGYVFLAELAEHATCWAWQSAIRRLRTLTGVRHFRGHDFRRTVRTNLSRLGVARVVAEAVLNHAPRGIVGVYDLYEFIDERRDALGRWEAHLAKLGCTV